MRCQRAGLHEPGRSHPQFFASFAFCFEPLLLGSIRASPATASRGPRLAFGGESTLSLEERFFDRGPRRNTRISFRVFRAVTRFKETEMLRFVRSLSSAVGEPQRSAAPQLSGESGALVSGGDSFCPRMLANRREFVFVHLAWLAVTFAAR